MPRKENKPKVRKEREREKTDWLLQLFVLVLIGFKVASSIKGLKVAKRVCSEFEVHIILWTSFTCDKWRQLRAIEGSVSLWQWNSIKIIAGPSQGMFILSHVPNKSFITDPVPMYYRPRNRSILMIIRDFHPKSGSSRHQLCLEIHLWLV